MASSGSISEIKASSIFNVDGLVALVTGGGTGIGLMIAKALAQNGAAKVYIAGRRLKVLEEAASAIGSNVIPIQCDVTSKDELRTAVLTVEKEVGYLNLLVCNSGISGPSPPKLTPETTLEQWATANFDQKIEDYTNTFMVNVSSVWFTTMAFLMLLDAGNKKGNVTQSSQVVITSSIGGFNKKAPGGWAYNQSKAAVTHASKALGVALPQWNIRSNCIAPGLFPSEMTGAVMKQYPGESGGPGPIPTSVVPAGRMGNEEEMGGTILYLASKAGGYVNGAVIVIDGGRLGMYPSVN